MVPPQVKVIWKNSASDVTHVFKAGKGLSRVKGKAMLVVRTWAVPLSECILNKHLIYVMQSSAMSSFSPVGLLPS